MRRVIASEFVTLDGVMEEPSWTFQFWTEEIARFKFNELFASDALLLGRVTYQGFAAAWPSMTDEEGFADRMNSLPKHVVSTTLEEPFEWNNSTLIKGNVAEEVSELKQQPAQDLLIYGSGELVNTLIQHDLIDENRLMVYPIVLESGTRLFKEGVNTTLALVETKSFESSVVELSYEPAEVDRKVTE